MDEYYIDGDILLITKEEAYKEYLNNAKKYINTKIREACKDSTDLSIPIKRIPKEIMKEIKEEYRTIETGEYITIMWGKKEKIYSVRHSDNNTIENK